VRYRPLIEHDGRTDGAPVSVREVRAPGAKRAAALCGDTIDSGKTALDADDLDAARFYLTRAQRLPGCAERTTKPQEKLAEALAKRDAANQASLWPADQPILPA